MKHEVGSFEAKTRLSELLRLAASGDEIVVMRRGERIAVIVGKDRYDQLVQPIMKDWRESLMEHRKLLRSSGQAISTQQFEATMRESKAQRR